MKLGFFSLLLRNRIKNLWYLIPPTWEEGTIALLPLRNKLVEGILIEIKDSSFTLNYKAKAAVHFKRKLENDYWERIKELSSFWSLNIGKLIYNIERKLHLLQEEPLRDTIDCQGVDYPTLNLRNDQIEVYSKLNDNERGKYCLLAPPGWGKTELLLKLSLEIWESGKSVLILIPEIPTSEWLLKRATSIYGPIFKLWNSSVSPAKKLKTLSRIISSPAIVIGTRSAMFLPIFLLDTIIVDECHDASFYQEFSPPYEAVTSLTNVYSCRIIITTATPDEKIFEIIDKGGFSLLTVGDFKKPLISVNDTTDFPSKRSLISILRTFYRKEVTLIYLNHRGFSNRILGLKSIEYLKCKICHRYLSFYSSKSLWLCNFCDKAWKPSDYKDLGHKFSYPGTGVEKICTLLQRYLPKESIHWVSSDLGRKEISNIYELISKGGSLVVIMTQIMIKGYHFPSVGNLIYIDTSFSRNLPLIPKIIGLIQFSGRGRDIPLEIDTDDPKQPLFSWKRGNYLEELALNSRKPFVLCLYSEGGRKFSYKVPLFEIEKFIKNLGEECNLEKLTLRS